MRNKIIIMGGLLFTTMIAFAGVEVKDIKNIGSIKIKNEKEVKFPKMATISFDTAINTGLKQVSGKLLKIELENENGYLVYGLEIVTDDENIKDVKIDAGNGKVLEITADENNEEKEESKEYSNDEENKENKNNNIKEENENDNDEEKEVENK